MLMTHKGGTLEWFKHQVTEAIFFPKELHKDLILSHNVWG